MADFDAVTRGAPPHPTLQKALRHWHDAPAQALDLGCGMGRDSLELLRRGWQVQAIDNRQDALDGLLQQTDAVQRERLQTLCGDFQTLPLPAAELINASFALPFCPPEHFPALWRGIEQALRPKGLFAGHFFGIRDQWQARNLTLHTCEALQALLVDWELLQFEEHEWDGKTATGHKKHWHLFAVVARRL
ncbi:class I SAM-dependent methyltransferase [Aquipseudomonas alcaligenes]|uniref:class I SAM-dependent methyltransferase n=1 Tax=Aquipseudomonas alcaligenes TaxID=43263 RepID=UPI003747A587